jgi:hypothetical protein
LHSRRATLPAQLKPTEALARARGIARFGTRGPGRRVTKSDGSKVEVHLDKSFNVVEGHGGHHGGADGDGPAGASFRGASANGATAGA